jgi:hypothetical protein
MFSYSGFNELFMQFINNPELRQLPDRVILANSPIAVKLYAFSPRKVRQTGGLKEFIIPISCTFRFATP